MADSFSILLAGLIIVFFVYKFMSGPPSPMAGHPASRTASSSSRQRRFPVSELQVSTISGMFPHIPRDAISDDLAYTGNTEASIENILAGRIVLRPPPPSQQPNPSTGPTVAYNPNLTSAPDKVWQDSPTDRAENLRQRKEWMLKQARDKFVNSQK